MKFKEFLRSTEEIEPYKYHCEVTWITKDPRTGEKSEQKAVLLLDRMYRDSRCRSIKEFLRDDNLLGVIGCSYIPSEQVMDSYFKDIKRWIIPK